MEKAAGFCQQGNESSGPIKCFVVVVVVFVVVVG
jgi:hypothetical protein